MAYGVDKYPDPPELPEGHYEYERDIDGKPIRVWVRDFDDDGNRIEEGIMKNDGGPAFPQSPVDFGNGPDDPAGYGMGGMTLREWFAGQAMARFVVDRHDADQMAMGNSPDYKKQAYECYLFADAMLAERNKHE